MIHSARSYTTRLRRAPDTAAGRLNVLAPQTSWLVPASGCSKPPKTRSRDAHRRLRDLWQDHGMGWSYLHLMGGAPPHRKASARATSWDRAGGEVSRFRAATDPGARCRSRAPSRKQPPPIVLPKRKYVFGHEREQEVGRRFAGASRKI
jgi:hypothetical protein